MLKGVDVSYHQGSINWDKVKLQIDFAILRGGYGKNNIDTQFIRNVKECNRLNIPVGVYWFSYALSPKMVKKEAKYCLELIKDYKIEYPVCFDLEYDSIRYAKEQGITIDKSLASEMVVEFCEEVENQGYYAMNYSNKDYLNNMFDESTEKYDLWYAYWNSKLDRKVNLWQYSSTGKVDGINGNVDMNISYLEYPNIIKEKGLNNLGEKEIDYKKKYYDLKQEITNLINKYKGE